MQSVDSGSEVSPPATGRRTDGSPATLSPSVPPSGLSVLHNVPKLGRAAHGVGAAVRSLSRAQAALMSVAVVVQDGPGEQFPAEEAAGVKLYRLPAHPLARHGFHPLFFRDRRVRGHQIVHQHSTWTAVSVLSLWLAARGAKVIYTPHSGLHPALSGNGRLRKLLASWVYERWVLRRAAAVQALSHAELQDVRRLGVQAPVAVIPNGVDDELLYSPARPGRLRARLGLDPQRRILLFLSRVQPVKGIDVLIPLLAEQSEFRASWVLVVVGPGQPEFLATLGDLARQSGLGEQVVFAGPLYGDDKIDAYDDCDAFVLPSLLEGMPMVVLEAMARRKPVLATTATPIPEIETHAAGFLSGLSLPERREALGRLLALTDEERRAMGQRAHEVVEHSYRWQMVAGMTLHLYRWLLDPRLPRPDFVFPARSGEQGQAGRR